jgi:hypothetical protein
MYGKVPINSAPLYLIPRLPECLPPKLRHRGSGVLDHCQHRTVIGEYIIPILSSFEKDNFISAGAWVASFLSAIGICFGGARLIRLKIEIQVAYFGFNYAYSWLPL